MGIIDNGIKMIKTDSKTISILSKIKGWHLIRGNNLSYTDIVNALVLKDARKKGLIDNNGNNNYHPEKKGKMGTSLEGGEENPEKGGDMHGNRKEEKIQNMDGTGERLDEKQLS